MMASNKYAGVSADLYCLRGKRSEKLTRMGGSDQLMQVEMKPQVDQMEFTAILSQLCLVRITIERKRSSEEWFVSVDLIVK